MKIRIAAWSIIGIVLIATVVNFWPEKVIEREEGVLCPDIPLQTEASRKTPWLTDDFMITALADFKLRARVLNRRNYSSGRESDLSPVDFALGWGPMSDQFVLNQLDISQGHRWYNWKVDGIMPIPQQDIERSSANMHIIPASDEVADMVDDVYEGSIVILEGYLVKVTADDGWHWISSTSRNDTGHGACEIVWVETIEVIN